MNATDCRTETGLRKFFNREARHFPRNDWMHHYGVRVGSTMIYAADTRELWTKFVTRVNEKRVALKRKPINAAV